MSMLQRCRIVQVDNKMASTKKWRESDTIKFVELYEKAECLWNYRHAGYKHRNARDKAIQRIIDQMDLPDFGVNELKNKIKNIRSTYQQEVNKIRRSKQSFGNDIIEEYKTNLAWFPIADRFLSNIINSGKNATLKAEEDDMFYQSNQSALFNFVETEMTNGDTLGEIEEKISPYSLTIDQIKEEIIEADDYNPTPITLPSAKRKKTFPIKSEDADLTNDTCQKDEWYYFGNNVSCQLRNLPLEIALGCQKRIMDILTQERINHLIKFQTEENNSRCAQ